MRLLQRRIDHLRKEIRLRDLMVHFGHRFRLHGNMICPFHEERNPSARLYDNQDTFWCWVCSPTHGMDVIEYALFELSLESVVDPDLKLPENKRHSLATFRSIEYLEEEFQTSYQSTPWEEKLEQALRRELPPEDPERYWRASHRQVLRLLSQVTDLAKWSVYDFHITELLPLRSSQISSQRPIWHSLREGLAKLSTAPN